MVKNYKRTIKYPGQVTEPKSSVPARILLFCDGRVLSLIHISSFAEIEGVEYILVTAGAMDGGTPNITDAVTVYNRLGEAAQALK